MRFLLKPGRRLGSGFPFGPDSPARVIVSRGRRRSPEMEHRDETFTMDGDGCVPTLADTASALGLGLQALAATALGEITRAPYIVASAFIPLYRAFTSPSARDGCGRVPAS